MPATGVWVYSGGEVQDKEVKALDHGAFLKGFSWN